MGCAFEHADRHGGPRQPRPPPRRDALRDRVHSGSAGGVGIECPAGLPSPTTCGNFKYQISSQTRLRTSPRFAAGPHALRQRVRAACRQRRPIHRHATATGPGIPNCPISLTGTGAVEDNNRTLRLPYRARRAWTCQRHRGAAKAGARGDRTAGSTGGAAAAASPAAGCPDRRDRSSRRDRDGVVSCGRRQLAGDDAHHDARPAQ